MGIDFGRPSDDGEWTEEQLKLLSVIPHVTGSLSIIGSTYIIYDIASDRKKWSSTYHRLIFAMGIVDFISSFATSFSTIPMPEDAGDLSYGNNATCALQGFFVHFNIASPLYNLMLSIYFLLTVTFKWTKEDIKAKLEIWLHGIPLVWSVTTAVVVLVQGGFNDSTLWCWINSSPKGCNSSDEECEKCTLCGTSLRLWFFFGPLWFAAFGTIVAMGILVSSVRRTEKKAERWRPTTVHRKLEKRASQSARDFSNKAIQSASKLSSTLSLKAEERASKSARELSNQSFHAKEEGASKSARDSSNKSRSVEFSGAVDFSDDKEEASKGEKGSSNHTRSVQVSCVEKEGASKSVSESSNRSLLNFKSLRDFRTSIPSNLHGWRVSRKSVADIEERRERRKALRMTRIVTGQAFRYCAVFWITWVFGSTNRVLQFTRGHSYFWVMFLHVIFTPMQGLLNCIVYVDLRLKKWWKGKRMAWSKARAKRKRRRHRSEENPNPTASIRQADSYDTHDNDVCDLYDIDQSECF